MHTNPVFVNNPTPFAYRVSYLTNRYMAPLGRYLERAHDMLWHEWVVIFCVAQGGIWSAKDVCGATGRPKNTISRAIQKLVGLGLLTRTEQPEDARVQLLSLTDAGRKFYEEVLPVLQRQEEKLYGGLSTAERDHLDQLLTKLVSRLEAGAELAAEQ